MSCPSARMGSIGQLGFSSVASVLHARRGGLPGFRCPAQRVAPKASTATAAEAEQECLSCATDTQAIRRFKIFETVPECQQPPFGV